MEMNDTTKAHLERCYSIFLSFNKNSARWTRCRDALRQMLGHDKFYSTSVGPVAEAMDAFVAAARSEGLGNYDWAPGLWQSAETALVAYSPIEYTNAWTRSEQPVNCTCTEARPTIDELVAAILPGKNTKWIEAVTAKPKINDRLLTLITRILGNVRAHVIDEQVGINACAAVDAFRNAMGPSVWDRSLEVSAKTQEAEIAWLASVAVSVLPAERAVEIMQLATDVIYALGPVYGVVPEYAYTLQPAVERFPPREPPPMFDREPFKRVG